jgi:hypothetical protein
MKKIIAAITVCLLLYCGGLYAQHYNLASVDSECDGNKS